MTSKVRSRVLGYEKIGSCNKAAAYYYIFRKFLYQVMLREKDHMEDPKRSCDRPPTNIKCNGCDASHSAQSGL